MPVAGPLSHIGISIGHPDKSNPFYDALLTSIGYGRWTLGIPVHASGRKRSCDAA